MRTLIVDDDREYGGMLEAAFAQYGSTLIAENGTEAFKAFSKALKKCCPFHLILLDLNMPMRGGVDTVMSIRQMERKLKLFGDKASIIIAVSGLNDEEEAKRALDAGCNEFVAKAEGVRFLVDIVNEQGILQEGKDQEFDSKIREQLFQQSKDE